MEKIETLHGTLIGFLINKSELPKTAKEINRSYPVAENGIGFDAYKEVIQYMTNKKFYLIIKKTYEY